MEISHSYSNKDLTIFVNGRIGSSEVSEFQKEVLSLLDEHAGGIEELIIDASQLEFISSMGLRVLLMLRRRQKNMRIINCNTEVFTVFKMTGFTGIINIEKVLPEFTIEGLPEIPGLEDTYKLDNETMLRVFPEGTSKADIDNILKLTKTAFTMDVPTPMTFEIKKVDGNFGITYESVAPVDVDAATAGKFIRDLHDHSTPVNGIIPSAQERLIQDIQRLNPYLGESATDMLRQLLSMLPDTPTLLHGNLTLDSIMQSSGVLLLVDMSQECYGNPLIDLSHLYFFLPEDKKGEWFNEFLKAYFNTSSWNVISKKRHNIMIVALIWHFCSLVLYGKPSTVNIERLQSDFEKHIVCNWGNVLAGLSLKTDISEDIHKLERKHFFTDMNVNMDWLAEKLSTNRHYLSDYFNKTLQTTFSEYINNLRLEYAAELIKRGQIPMTQIPYACGYNNDHTFRRLFKERYGCTPPKYNRKQNIKN